MNWALVDRSGRSLSPSCACYPAALKSVLASLPAESQDELLRLLEEACSEGAQRRLSIMQPERPLVVVDILPLRLPQTTETPALVVVHDAAEFDGSYDRLRSLARRNEAILRSSMDGFFVVAADCHFLEVNEAFCRMTGYTAPELLRMKISDLEVHERGGAVASHTGTGLHHFPTAHRHKNGQIVYLDITVNVLHDNGVKILVGLARDLTERKHAEDELARLTRQQQLILDSVAEGITGLDPAGKITLANPVAAELLGYGVGELIGRPAQELFFPAQHRSPKCSGPSCPICCVLQQERRAVQVETGFARRDGSHFPVECSISSMYAGPDIVGAVLVFKDMTERQRAEQERRVFEAQIQQAQKLESLGLLAGGIAHDLNNILAGVQGHACLALADVPDDSAMSQRLQRIVGACERASKVIRNVLTYSGQVTCDTVPLDLNELVESVGEFMRAAVPPAIALDFRLAAQPLRIEADGGQLQQALSSLLVNAVEAIGEKPGRITLSTAWTQLTDADVLRSYPGQNLAPGGYAAVQVEDSGCGMAPDTLKRIFEPFFSGKGTGRGLGLSAMHGVVRAHHGGIRVESELGAGTRFTILLPAGVQPATAEHPGETLPDGDGQAVILVIDDEEEVREVIKDMLTSRGWHVLTAADGAAGLELFKRQAGRIDLVILDMTMPGLSGAEVFRELRALRADARVVVASGYSARQTPARFGGAEPAAFITKPFAMETLIETVARILGENGGGAEPQAHPHAGQGFDVAERKPRKHIRTARP